MFAALALILIKPDIKDEVLASQARLGKLGLPVTKAALAEYVPSAITKESNAVLRSITSKFKWSPKPGEPEPVQDIDWEATIVKLRRLASQVDPLTIDDPSDPMTGFPGNAAFKTLLKAMTRKALDAGTSDVMRIELLSLSRRLMMNKSWNRNLVSHLVVVGMHSVYVKRATDFAKANPGWFAKHKDLIAPFPQPDFDEILTGEFVGSATSLTGGFPLRDRKSFKKGYRPEWALVCFRNWEVVYPACRGVKTFSGLQAALKPIRGKLRSVKDDKEVLYFTIPFEVDYSKLDERAKKRNSDLAALGVL